jgi:POT family proton-dependent oligopeptide transporter
MSQIQPTNFFKTLFLDILHCSYCFTEMWERFSYYGMRAYLFCFLTSSLAKGAGHGVRAMCCELILCGFISPRRIGGSLRVSLAVVLLWHDFPRIDSRNALYIWVFIIGNGLFKPNMTSIISNAYIIILRKKTVLIQCTIWV